MALPLDLSGPTARGDGAMLAGAVCLLLAWLKRADHATLRWRTLSLIGGGQPGKEQIMPQFAESVDVAAPMEKAFDYVTDQTRTVRNGTSSPAPCSACRPP